MNIATRLLLGYAYLVTLIVVVATTAAVGIHSLGATIAAVHERDSASVRAALRMVEAIERLDSAVLTRLLEPAAPTTAMDAADATFRAALAEARAHTALAEEEAIITDIEDFYQRYREARERLLAAAPERPLAAYEAEAFPRFEVVKRRVLDLIGVNQQKMAAADRAARSEAKSKAVTHGLLVLVALLSLIVLWRAMDRDVLSRLVELKVVAQSIAAGEVHRRADEGHRDELGVVAAQLNAILDRQEAMRGQVEARHSQLRQVVLALLAAWPTPAVLLSPAGAILASTMAEDDTEAVVQAAGLVSLAHARDGLEVADGGRSYLFRRLTVAPESSPCWLVTANGGASVAHEEES